MSSTSFISTLFAKNKTSFSQFPDKGLAQQFVDGLYALLFASYEEKYATEEALQMEMDLIKGWLQILLQKTLSNELEAKKIANHFFDELPRIYDYLMEDAKAVLEFDPAAKSLEEVLVAYPGFYTTAIYRFAHVLYLKGIRLLPRLFCEYAHSKTGIDIHPGAKIGRSFFIDHGTGIVIGETAVIGKRVKIYQGVTLGSLTVSKQEASAKRHPTIQDNVIIYANATILGGKTVVGHDSVIGGSAWVTKSVFPYSIVYQKSDVTIRDKNPLPETIDFVI